MSKIIIASAAATAALLVSPLMAFAQVDVGLDANTSVDTSVVVPVNATVDVSATSSTSANDNEQGNTSGNGNSSLSLDANASGVAVSSSEQVSTDEDLQVFGKNLAKIDTAVSSVTTSAKDRIDVSYKHHGKLFAFIPVSVTSHTVMTVGKNNEPQVTTSMAWWNFLVSGTHGIAARVDASLSPESPTAVLVSANASASARARAVEAIVNAHNQAEADAQITTAASAKTQ